MTLTDTGPLVGLFNRRDSRHADCLLAARQLPVGPLLTTWPCLTEAMYLLHRAKGAKGQQNLWDAVSKEIVQLADLSSAEVFRMQELMEQYRNVPMDLADASLVAIAESRGIKRLFTLDSDFRIYQLADRSFLELIP